MSLQTQPGTHCICELISGVHAAFGSEDRIVQGSLACKILWYTVVHGVCYICSWTGGNEPRSAAEMDPISPTPAWLVKKALQWGKQLKRNNTEMESEPS